MDGEATSSIKLQEVYAKHKARTIKVNQKSKMLYLSPVLEIF